MLFTLNGLSACPSPSIPRWLQGAVVNQKNMEGGTAGSHAVCPLGLDCTDIVSVTTWSFRVMLAPTAEILHPAYNLPFWGPCTLRPPVFWHPGLSTLSSLWPVAACSVGLPSGPSLSHCSSCLPRGVALGRIQSFVRLCLENCGKVSPCLQFLTAPRLPILPKVDTSGGYTSTISQCFGLPSLLAPLVKFHL